MNSLSPIQYFNFTRLFCSTFGHSFKIRNKITNYVNEYTCKIYGQEVTNGAAGNKETLTFKNKELNACLSAFFQKKTQKTTTP